MSACEAWTWAWFLGVAVGSFFLGMIVMTCFSTAAYDCGYEDALADHGVEL